MSLKLTSTPDGTKKLSFTTGFSFAGILIGLFVGICEGAFVLLHQRHLRLIEPAAGSVILLLAPCIDALGYGFLGGILGSAAALCHRKLHGRTSLVCCPWPRYRGRPLDLFAGSRVDRSQQISALASCGHCASGWLGCGYHGSGMLANYCMPLHRIRWPVVVDLAVFVSKMRRNYWDGVCGCRDRPDDHNGAGCTLPSAVPRDGWRPA